MTKKSAVVIGLGNAGSQVAYLAEKKYPELFDTIYINTSEADLSMVSNSDTALKFKIGDKDEVEGSAKNRTKMKEYLKKDIIRILTNERLQDTIVDKKYGFIISSTAGGTGSGSAPVLMDIIHQMFPSTNFILVCILPQINASMMEQGNTKEFLDELYNTLDSDTTYMVYDNESTANLSPTKSLEVVNENIVEDLRVLTGVDNFPTPYESIDEADMESIITTPGRLLVVRLNKNLTEKSMEDNKLDDMIIKGIKQSCHTETDRNKKVTRWGIITYFTDEVNKLYSPALEGLIEFIGTPIERFNHNSINNNNENTNFLYMIASGLSPTNDRARKIISRIEELKNALASDESTKYILEGEGASYDVMAERKKANKKLHQLEELDPMASFNKFL